MKTVTHREMRNASGEILRAVAAGETFQVTNGGQVAAVISPPNRDPLEQLKALGQIRAARRPVTDLSKIRRRKAKRSSAELVADVRGRW
ncbi:MAG TPA: type II toxin-antitoxin system prevent-host-death family antitoxin [Acidothermaceae bacterium]|nr:type II toxin-antitoxin system prevent-host-death family antitoxin [Acidothermaceae bacterium]